MSRLARNRALLLGVTALASLAIPSRSPAAAAGPRWILIGAPAFCHAAQTLVPGKPDFRFILNSDDSIDLIVQGLDWAVEDRDPLRLDVQGGSLRRQGVGASGYRPSYARKGFRATIDARLFDEVVGTGVLNIYLNGRQIALLDPDGLAPAIARARDCQAKLKARIRSMPTIYAPPAPPPPLPVAIPPRRGPAKAAVRSGYIGPDDYPAIALRAGEEGDTSFQVEVGTDGAVTKCEIVQSSGSVELDYATCRLFRQRYRFWPALDESSAPIASTVRTRLRWRIPDDEPGPGALPVPPPPPGG